MKANGKNGFDWLPFVQGVYLEDLAHLSAYQPWEYYNYLRQIAYSQCMVNGLNPSLQHLIQRNLELIPGRMNFPAQFPEYPPETGMMTQLPRREQIVEENSSSLDMEKSLDENENKKIVTEAMCKDQMRNGKNEFGLHLNEGHCGNDLSDKSMRWDDSNDSAAEKISHKDDGLVMNDLSSPLNQNQSAKVEVEVGVATVKKMELSGEEELSRSSVSSQGTISGVPGVKWPSENGWSNLPDTQATTKELKDTKYDCLKDVEAQITEADSITLSTSKAHDGGYGIPVSPKGRSEGVMLTTSPSGSCFATRIKTDSPTAAQMSSESLKQHGAAEESTVGLTSHFKTEIPDQWSDAIGASQSLAKLSRSNNSSPGSTMSDAQEQLAPDAVSPSVSPFLNLPGVRASTLSPSSLLMQTSSPSCVVPSSWHSFPFSSMASTSCTSAASSQHTQAFLSPFPSSMICRFCNNCFQSPIELYDHESNRCPEIKKTIAQTLDIPNAVPLYRSPVHETPMSETGLDREDVVKSKRKSEPQIDAEEQGVLKSFYHENSGPSAEDLERLRLSLGLPVGALHMCFQKMRLHERKFSGGLIGSPPHAPMLSPRDVNGGIFPLLVESWQNALAVGALQREKLQSGRQANLPKIERAGNEEVEAVERVSQVEPLDLSLRKDDTVADGAVDLRVREKTAEPRRGFTRSDDSVGTPDSFQNVPDWNSDNALRLLASTSKRREVSVGYAGSELGNFGLHRMLPFVNGYRNSHKPGGEYFQVRISSYRIITNNLFICM